jgi:hypothetical protein
VEKPTPHVGQKNRSTCAKVRCSSNRESGVLVFKFNQLLPQSFAQGAYVKVCIDKGFYPAEYPAVSNLIERLCSSDLLALMPCWGAKQRQRSYWATARQF